MTETTEMIKVIANDSEVRIDRIVENYQQLEKENAELKKKCQDRCDECWEEYIKLTKAKDLLLRLSVCLEGHSNNNFKYELIKKQNNS